MVFRLLRTNVQHKVTYARLGMETATLTTSVCPTDKAVGLVSPETTSQITTNYHLKPSFYSVLTAKVQMKYSCSIFFYYYFFSSINLY